MLYMVRSGNVSMHLGNFRIAGALSRGWSSRSYSNADNAYFFESSGSTNVTPSTDGYRWDGLPLRCLSTV